MPATAYAKTYRIGVLADILNKDFQPQFQQMQQEILAVVGNDASVEFRAEDILINNFDLELAKSQYQTVLKSPVDIILAFGPVNNEVVNSVKRHTKPTILFGAVNTDVIPIDRSRDVSGVNNFTYIVAPWSYKQDLQDFQSLYSFKRVAVVGAYGPWDVPVTNATLQDTFAELGADYKLVQYQSIDQLAAELGDVDAVYLAEGFGIPSAEVKQMADLFIERKLPSFTSSQSEDVVNGWLATNNPNTNFERLFRRIALSIEAVVNGENLSRRPVFMEVVDTLTVNYNTAERVGVPIRFSQIASINLVGNFDELVSDRTYTVEQAVDVALTNNLSLLASGVDVELAEENLASAKTTYYPDFSINASGRKIDPDLAALSGGSNPEQQVSGSANLSQVLYSEDGSAAIGIQKSLLGAERENYNTVVLDTVLTTTRACFNLLRLKNALESQAENLEITRRNLAVAEQNFAAGQAGRADILRFRSELATNLQNVVDAINAYRQGQNSLNAILNEPLSQRIEVADVDLKGGPFEPKEFGYRELSGILDNPAEQELFQSFLLKQAFELSPELEALNHNLAAIERDIKQYGWRRFIPTVSASAQYNRIYDRSGVGVPDPNLALDDDYNVGLVFSIPIFNQNSDNVSRRIAKKQKQQLMLRIASQKQAIENSIRDSVLDLSSRIAAIELSQVSEQAALQSLELTEASYANGAATITELIDSQNNYLQTQLASSNALYNFIDSALGLERAVGTYLFLDSSAIDPEQFRLDYLQYREQNQLDGSR